jgi:ribosomal protein L11 methyltransferase
MSAGVYRIVARVRGSDAAEAVLGLLDSATGAVAAFETGLGEWRLEAYPRAALVNPDLAARLALAAVAAGGDLIDLHQEELLDRDWLEENRLAFPPLQIGRFFVYGSHYHGMVPPASIGVVLDAATAFGTGEHPSTRGCLLALEALARRRPIRRPLDIGTGTGILAIAAAKLGRRPVGASDMDAHVVGVARGNVARNGVKQLVRVSRAAGYRSGALRRRRYDLILSNILAQPLARMAADLTRYLAPGGYAVLSGLLKRQEAIVLAPHRGLGLFLDRRVVIDGWSTLVLRGGARGPHPPSASEGGLGRGTAAPIYRPVR